MIRRKPVTGSAGVSPSSSSSPPPPPPPPEDPKSSEETYSSSGTRETERGTGSIEVARPGVYNIRFAAGKTLKQKLVRFGEVLGIDEAAKHMEEIFEKALDLALEKKDPQRKLERRRKREAARSKTRLDEASPPKSRLDEAAGAKKREARAGSRAFQAPLVFRTSSRLPPGES